MTSTSPIPSPAPARRTSPRKRAWKTPPKSTEFKSALFTDEDFSPLNNSWAQDVQEDKDLSAQFKQQCRSEGRRKAAAPKKASTKPCFVKSLALTETLFTTSTRKSERVRQREIKKDSKTEIETETVFEEKRVARKRHLSNTSTVVDESEGCSPAKRSPLKRIGAPSSSGRPSRKTARGEEGPVKSPARARLFQGHQKSASPSLEFHTRDHWEEPSLGWCNDQKTLDRRNKELEKAKEKPVYQRYLEEIPRDKRIKDVHPRTPNKFINFSRRSWDSQVRQWKKKLYMWAGEEPSDSVNTSFCSYDSDDQRESENENVENAPILASLKTENIVVRPETDAMASLLGRFDMDTRQGADESTLKALPTGVEPSGPVDFSTL